jgi:chemotaxis protein MotB
VESNDTEEGRARNRRVTLMILSTLPDASSDVFDNSADALHDSETDSHSDPLPGTSA